MSTNYYWKDGLEIPIELISERLYKFTDIINDASKDFNVTDDCWKRHIGKLSFKGRYCNKCGHKIEYDYCPECSNKEYIPIQKFSFTNFMHKEILEELAKEESMLVLKLLGKYFIEDEYGANYTPLEMIAIINKCKVIDLCQEYFS